LHAGETVCTASILGVRPKKKATILVALEVVSGGPDYLLLRMQGELSAISLEE
jgi:hypothetical protein